MSQDRGTPGTQTALREANRARLLDAVKRFGALTQIELADATGLSTATVSTIVKELVAAGVVQTKPVSRSGRRALQVSLARRLGLVAGLHYGARELRVALADLAGTVVAEQRMPLPAEHRADTGLDRGAALINDMLEAIGASRSELRGAGLGIAAPVAAPSGALAARGIQRGWDEVPIAASMERRLGIEVFVENDANLAALAEYRLGAAQGCGQAVYLYVGHGVGAGILLGGHILRGHAGTAGEIGHIRVVEDGALCHCGHRGCLETVVNASALAESLRDAHGLLSLRDIVAKAMAGDPDCRQAVSRAGRAVGQAVAALVNVLNPELIVVGGSLGRCGEILIAPLRGVVAEATLPPQAGPPGIVQGTLGDAAGVRGAITLATDSVTVTADLKEVDLDA